MKDIKNPIPNKDDLLRRMKGCHMFSQFYLNSRFWQIDLRKEGRHTTAFVVHKGHYEWIVMSFGLKMLLVNLKKMYEMFRACIKFLVVYIDDILSFS